MEADEPRIVALGATPPELETTAPKSVQDFLSLWLAQVAKSSARCYRTALADFARMLNLDVETAIAAVFAGPREAAVLAQRWRADMLERNLAPKSINTRLSALRSLVKYAGEELHIIPWRLLVRDVKADRLRDTRGPGTEGFKRLHAATSGADTATAARDRAIVRLLFSMALRRAEVVSLDLEHLDAAGTDLGARGARLLVLAKGKRERVALTMPTQARRDLAAWLADRGLAPGPLFMAIDRWGNRGGRLSADAINEIVRKLAQKAGIGHVRPHGLRHAAITEACRKAKGNLRKVQEFSRHEDIQTVLIYLDALMDAGGEIAELVDQAGGSPTE